MNYPWYYKSQWNVYVDENRDVEVSKKGWSWSAFFGTVIWSFFMRHWYLAFGLLIGNIILVNVMKNQQDLTIISLVVSVLFGIKGNDWKNYILEQRRFVKTGVVEAWSYGEALEKAKQKASPR